MIDRVQMPPSDSDAEKCVLGSMVLRNDAIDLVADLRPSDFHELRHEKIFRAITEMWNGGHRAIDSVTLATELERRGDLATVGGAAYLIDIAEFVPHAEFARHYAATVRKKAKLRQIIAAGRETVSEASGHDADPDDIIRRIDRSILSIQESGTSGEFATMNDAVDAFEEREHNPAATHETGLIDLDRQINGGLGDAQLMIIGGRPGTGKSVLAAQIAAAFAMRGEPSLIVSLEMQKAEIAGRLAKTIDRQRLRRLPIQIIDAAGNLNRIASLIRLAARRDGLRLVVLDYLQLVESGDRSSNRERQVAEVSRTLKRLAMELSIPIIAACQLNRSSEHDGRKPRLSDLRESGSIEQDADIVGMLHRSGDDSELIIAKNRNGAPGIVPLAFKPAVFRFDNAALYSGRL